MKSSISGKPQLNRQINASIVFGMVQREGPLSRADLAKRSGIRATSISAIVQHLIDRSLLREVGRGQSTGGRHPILLDINPRGLHAVGFELAEDCINGVIVDLAGHILAHDQLRLDDSSVETVLPKCGQLLGRLCNSSGVEHSELAGLGVAVPGIIGKDKGEVVLSRPLGWQNVPLQEYLGEQLDLETHVLNNAMAGAMNEYYAARRADLRSLLYVLVSLQHGKDHAVTSLGCGIVLDGRAYFGEGEIAGELRVDIAHPLAMASGLSGRTSPGTLDELLESSRADPERFSVVWENFAENVAHVVSTGMDFISPGCVVIGSDIPELENLIGQRMQQVVEARTVAGLVAGLDNGSHKRGVVDLVFSSIGPETLARGAILPRLQGLSLAPLLRDGVLT